MSKSLKLSGYYVKNSMMLFSRKTPGVNRKCKKSQNIFQ